MFMYITTAIKGV